MSTVRPLPAAIADSSSSSGSDSTLTQRMSSSTASASSAAVLPTPENMILSGGTPAASARLSSPPETTSAPAPSFAKRRDHRLVGIGLHRVADERRHVGEGVGEHAVVPLQRRGRIAIERRADRLREACEIDRLGVQHAVAIGEVVHGALSRSANRAGSFFFGPAARSAGRRRRSPAGCSGDGCRAARGCVRRPAGPLLEHVAAGRRVERTLAAAGRKRQRQGKHADHGNEQTASDPAGTMQAPKFRAP